MAITIITTPSAANANSYISLEDANSYMEAHLQASAWADLDDERRKAALVSSTRFLETLKFSGMRSTQSQALAWPRTGVTDSDGYVLSGIPQKLKSAQVEYAIWQLTEEDRLAGDFELSNMDSVEIGPIKYTVGENATIIPKHIADILSSIGPQVVQTSDNGPVPRFRW